MKGIVFTEFLKMVETSYGFDMVDTIIEKSNLPSEGVYTSVGTYSHEEIISLTKNLSIETEVEITQLLKLFGEYLFNVLNQGHPHFAKSAADAFDFLEKVETYIHVEVRKLYPDAKLPNFKTNRSANGRQLEMEYESVRHLEDLCEGLIIGCLSYYKCSATITRKALKSGNELFIIIKTEH